MADDLRDAALTYHREPKPGKLEVTPTKPLANQRDLALAYSPGVAVAKIRLPGLLQAIQTQHSGRI